MPNPSIDLDTLCDHFHLPITDVAKKLGVCATVLKKICRKNGISRWPHRKIKSLEKTIATLEAVKTRNPAQQAKIQLELDAAKSSRDMLLRNPNAATDSKGLKGRRRINRLKALHSSSGSDSLEGDFSDSDSKPSSYTTRTARSTNQDEFDDNDDASFTSDATSPHPSPRGSSASKNPKWPLRNPNPANLNSSNGLRSQSVTYPNQPDLLNLPQRCYSVGGALPLPPFSQAYYTPQPSVSPTRGNPTTRHSEQPPFPQVAGYCPMIPGYTGFSMTGQFPSMVSIGNSSIPREAQSGNTSAGRTQSDSKINAHHMLPQMYQGMVPPGFSYPYGMPYLHPGMFDPNAVPNIHSRAFPSFYPPVMTRSSSLNPMASATGANNSTVNFGDLMNLANIASNDSEQVVETSQKAKDSPTATEITAETVKSNESDMVHENESSLVEEKKQEEEAAAPIDKQNETGESVPEPPQE